MKLRATTIDAFLGGTFQLEQPCKGPRAGIDALLLAAIVPITGNAEQTVLDAGTGSGVIALSLATRYPHVKAVGVERMSVMAALAKRNIERNGLNKRIKIIEADVTCPVNELAAKGLFREHFDHVVANPPYYEAGRSRPCETREKSVAHQLQAGELAKWVRFLTAMAAPKGSLSFIHRPDILTELLPLLQGRFGGLKLLPVHAQADSPAIRVLIQGRKGCRAPLQIRPGLVLHDPGGQYAPLAERLLRQGEALTL